MKIKSIYSIKFVGAMLDDNSNTTVGVIESTTEAFSHDSYESISYDEIARNPRNYIGRKVKYQGEVIQVLEKGKSLQLRVNVTKGEYIYEDTIFVMYTRASDAESRILEKDIVDIYGVADDLITYKSAIGSQITIPKINADKIIVSASH